MNRKLLASNFFRDLCIVFILSTILTIKGRGDFSALLILILTPYLMGLKTSFVDWFIMGLAYLLKPLSSYFDRYALWLWDRKEYYYDSGNVGYKFRNRKWLRRRVEDIRYRARNEEQARKTGQEPTKHQLPLPFYPLTEDIFRQLFPLSFHRRFILPPQKPKVGALLIRSPLLTPEGLHGFGGDLFDDHEVSDGLKHTYIYQIRAHPLTDEKGIYSPHISGFYPLSDINFDNYLILTPKQEKIFLSYLLLRDSPPASLPNRLLP